MRIEGNVSLRPMGGDCLRDQGRGQEPELVPLARAGHGVRGRAPCRGAGARRAARPGDARLGQETDGRTIPQRSKEEANDYRYFPEPDLPPLRPSAEWVAELRAGLPELPAARRARYVDELGLSAYDAGVLTAEVAWPTTSTRWSRPGSRPRRRPTG